MIDRLLKAIGYPSGEVSSDGVSCSIVVDGRSVRVQNVRGRLVLSFSLGTPSDEGLRQLATLAAGRMLREAAALAWDSERRELVIWQDVPPMATEELMRRAFEVFCVSCDWWSDRAAETMETAPEMIIRG